MDLFDHDTMRHNLRSEKPALRKQGKQQCEALLAANPGGSVLSPANTVGLLHAAIEFETKELNSSSAKSKPVGADVVQFFVRAVRFCIRSGNLLAASARLLLDHLVQMIEDQSMTCHFQAMHKILLSEVLVPRMTHSSLPAQPQVAQQFGGLEGVIRCVQRMFTDHGGRRDPRNLKLLKAVCMCSFLDLRGDEAAQRGELLEGIAIEETGHDASSLAVLMACVECYTALLRLHGVNVITAVLPALCSLLDKVHGRVLGCQQKEKEAHYCSAVLQVLSAVHDVAVGLDGLIRCGLDLLRPSAKVLGNIVHSFLSDPTAWVATKRDNKGKVSKDAGVEKCGSSSWAFRTMGKLLFWHLQQTTVRLNCYADPAETNSNNHSAKRPRLQEAADGVDNSIWNRLQAVDLQKQATRHLMAGYLWILQAAVEVDNKDGLILLQLRACSPSVSLASLQAHCICQALTLLTSLLNAFMNLHDCCAVEACVAALTSVVDFSTPQRCGIGDCQCNRLQQCLCHLIDDITRNEGRLDLTSTGACTELLVKCIQHSILTVDLASRACKNLLDCWNVLQDSSLFTAHAAGFVLLACLNRFGCLVVLKHLLPPGNKFDQTQWHVGLAVVISAIQHELQGRGTVVDICAPAAVDAILFNTNTRGVGHNDDAPAASDWFAQEQEMHWFDSRDLFVFDVDNIPADCVSTNIRQISMNSWLAGISSLDACYGCMNDEVNAVEASQSSRLHASQCLFFCYCCMLEVMPTDLSHAVVINVAVTAALICAMVIDLITRFVQVSDFSEVERAVTVLLAGLRKLAAGKYNAIIARIRSGCSEAIRGLMKLLWMEVIQSIGRMGCTEGDGGFDEDFANSQPTTPIRAKSVAVSSFAGSYDQVNTGFCRLVDFASRLLKDDELLMVDLLRNDDGTGWKSTHAAEQKLMLASCIGCFGQLDIVQWLIGNDDSWRQQWGALGYGHVLRAIRGLLCAHFGSLQRKIVASFDMQDEAMEFAWSWIFPTDASLVNQLQSMWYLRALQLQCVAVIFARSSDISSIKVPAADIFGNCVKDNDLRVRIIAAGQTRHVLKHFKNTLKVYGALTPRYSLLPGATLLLSVSVFSAFSISCVGTHQQALWTTALWDILVWCSATSGNYSAAFRMILHCATARFSSSLGYESSASLLDENLDWLLYKWLANTDNTFTVQSFPFSAFANFQTGTIGVDFIKKYLARIVGVVCRVDPSPKRWALLLELCTLQFCNSSDANVSKLIRQSLPHVKAVEYHCMLMGRWCADSEQKRLQHTNAQYILQFLERFLDPIGVQEALSGHVSALIGAVVTTSLRASPFESPAVDITPPIAAANAALLEMSEVQSSLSDLLVDISRKLNFVSFQDMLSVCNLHSVQLSLKAVAHHGMIPAIQALRVTSALMVLLRYEQLDQVLSFHLALATIRKLLQSSSLAAVLTVLRLLSSSIAQEVITSRMNDNCKYELLWDIVCLVHVHFAALQDRVGPNDFTGKAAAIAQLGEVGDVKRQCDLESFVSFRNAVVDELSRKCDTLHFKGVCLLSLQSFLVDGSLSVNTAWSELIVQQLIDEIVETARRLLLGCGHTQFTLWLQLHALKTALCSAAFRFPSTCSEVRHIGEFLKIVLSAVSRSVVVKGDAATNPFVQLLVDVISLLGAEHSAVLPVGICSMLPALPLEGIATDPADPLLQSVWKMVVEDLLRINLSSDDACAASIANDVLCNLFLNRGSNSNSMLLHLANGSTSDSLLDNCCQQYSKPSLPKDRGSTFAVWFSRVFGFCHPFLGAATRDPITLSQSLLMFPKDANVLQILQGMVQEVWSNEVWRFGCHFSSQGDLTGLVTYDQYIRKLAFHTLLLNVHHQENGTPHGQDGSLLSYTLAASLVDTQIAERLFLLSICQVASAPASDGDSVLMATVFQRIIEDMGSSEHLQARQLACKTVAFLLRFLSSDFKLLHRLLCDPKDPKLSPCASMLLPLLSSSSQLLRLTRTAITCGNCSTAWLFIEIIAEVCKHFQRDGGGQHKADAKQVVNELLVELISSDSLGDPDLIYGLDVGSDVRLEALMYANAQDYGRALCAYETILTSSNDMQGTEVAQRGVLTSLQSMGATHTAAVYAKHFSKPSNAMAVAMGTWSLPSGAGAACDSVVEVNYFGGLQQKTGEILETVCKVTLFKESVVDFSRELQQLADTSLHSRFHAAISGELAVGEAEMTRIVASLHTLPATQQLITLGSAIERQSQATPGRISSFLNVVDNLLQRDCIDSHALAPQLHDFWRKASNIVRTVDSSCDGGSELGLGRAMVHAQLCMQESLLLWHKGLNDAAIANIKSKTIAPLRSSLQQSDRLPMNDTKMACGILLSDALRVTGTWLSQKGYHSAAEVIDNHLQPGLALIAESTGKAQSGSTVDWWALNDFAALCKREMSCHLAIARFFEQRYHNLQAKMISREWRQRQQHLADRLLEHEECARLRDECAAEVKALDNKVRLGNASFQQQRDEKEKEWKMTSRHISGLKREIDMDKKERDGTLAMRQESLLQGIKHCAQALQLSPALSATSADDQPDAGNVEVVFRMVGLWLSGANTAAIIEQSGGVGASMLGAASRVLFEQLERGSLPVYHFLPLHQQILSRLGGASTEEGQEEMQKVINLLAVELGTKYPFHVLPTLFALLHNNIDSAAASASTSAVHASLQALDVSNAGQPADERQAAAKRLLVAVHHKLQSIDARDQSVLVVQRLLVQYILLAKASTAETQQRGRTKGIRFSDIQPRGQRFHEQLQRDIEQGTVPLLTAHQPVVVYDHAACKVNTISVVSCEDKFDITDNGISRPKIICCVSSDGRQHRQLVKGGDDLRQDAVMQQVFHTVNLTLQRQRRGHGQQLCMRTYKVLPTSAQTGLLEFVEHTAPFGGILCDPPSSSKQQGAVTKTGLHSRHRPADWSHAKCREHLKSAVDAADKLKCFEEVCEHFQPVFRYFFLEQYRSPSCWFANRCNYVHSVAVNSMVGYILGIGDRHAHNLLVDVLTAEVIHIDFGIVFDQGQLLTVPETVPFRLTRDLVDGMGVMGTEGKFRRCCEQVLRTLRQQRNNLMVILEVVMFDPLYKWSLSPLQVRGRQQQQRADNSNVPIKPLPAGEAGFGNADAADRALARIRAKLQGYEEQLSAGDTALSVEDMASVANSAAMQPSNLSKIFPGWSPWL